MGVRVGIDVVDVRRIGALVDRYSEGELAAVFTAGERERAARAGAGRRAAHLAVCFGAKEAAGKALGTGLAGIDWCDVEARAEGSRLSVAMRGAAAERSASLGVGEWQASYAVADAMVVVQVVGWGA
ncbi:MAG TPA: 4'-phosphopantetheinyl transferase superfamily protein [Candidatus Dormibacteraeota bacterium]